MKFLFSKLSCLLLLGAVLAACTGTTTRTDSPKTPVVEVEAKAPRTSAAELLQQAGRLSAIEAAPLYLQTATLMRNQGDLTGALNALDRIPALVLTPAMKTDVALLRADIAAARTQPREVLSLLRPDNLPLLASLSPEQQIKVHNLRSAALAATGATLASALELVALDSLLNPVMQRSNHGSIWLKLGSLPQDQLQALSGATDDEVTRGWYELALVGRTYGTDMDRQLIELERWKLQWSKHPAALVLPPQMELLETLARERPRQVALLLPMATSAGTIVADAFMSAFYSLQESGGQVPVIRFYDTTNVTDIRPLHLQARRDGAQLVIGPLQKPLVAQLQQEADLGVPTLALNNLDGAAPKSPLLYQFALSPEDETRQLAVKAWTDGHRRGAILSPADDKNDEVANRKRDSFIASWENLGGKVLALDSYRADYTDTISRMLLITEADDRQEQLGKLLGRTVISEARRRQDIDFIFLVAQPASARQIVPSLAYLYAGDIPVYASQDIYAGTAKQADDRDLNGVIFGESPWVLGETGDISRVRQLFPMSTAQNLRLQAFGIDAFRLYPRLRLLESGTDASIPGASGTLKLGANHNIVRELVWSTINDGLIRPSK
jgi:outer membrane PBP1 activator LpoA protein